MTDEEIGLFNRYVSELSGICLDESKRYLLEARLAGLLTESGCRSYGELHARARAGDRRLERGIVDAITTNETYFFRNPNAFELLKHKIVPELLGEEVGKPVDILSAACSTGQEAFSIAMVLEEILFDLSRCRVRIIGTDISEAAVNAANRGEFTQLEVERGLDDRKLAKYFTRAGPRYRIRDDLRGLCQFQVDNLLAPRTRGSFNVILCRNVLIYFSPADKAKVLDRLLGLLKPNGVLLVGATESVLGLTPRLRRLEFHGAAYYVRV